MTPAAGRPPGPTVKNVGVIFYRPPLAAAQRRELQRLLGTFGHGKDRVRILHYGGDRALLQIIGGLDGWQARAHRGPETGIVAASRDLLAVGPRPEANTDQSPRAATWKQAIRLARTSGVNIRYISHSAPQQSAGSRDEPAKAKPKARAAVRNAAGGSRQTAIPQSPQRGGRQACRRCKGPVPASREKWGWLCEACERQQIPARARRAVPDVRLPPGKSVHAIPAGLPGLGKRS